MSKAKRFFYVLLFIVILGLCYQQITTAIDDRKYPAPGRLINIDGYRQHIKVMGKNTEPTVVLEAGGGCHSSHLSLIQSEVAKFARVISYDRAGYGWSDFRPQLRNSENIVQELHQLLQKSGIPGPYILVGHSFGGLNVRLYAMRYPDEVAGIVLADAVHEDQPYILPSSDKLLRNFVENPIGRFAIQVGGALGILRFVDIMRRPNKFSPEIYEMILAKSYTMNFLNTAFNEYTQFKNSQKQLKETGGLLGDKPLIVVSAGTCRVPSEFWKSWQLFQKDLVTKSTRGKQIIAKESGHKMNQEAPEVIVEAIRQIVFKEW